MKRILILVCLALFLGSFVSAGDAALQPDRFVNNKNGTVTDTQTGLMWADKDNGSDINWKNAKSYCEGYNGGGKSGWRMPTQDELAQLHYSEAYRFVIKQTHRTVWSSETSLLEAGFFILDSGNRGFCMQASSSGFRALPVRSGK